MSQSKNTKPVSYATSATYAADNNSKNDITAMSLLLKLIL